MATTYMLLASAIVSLGYSAVLNKPLGAGQIDKRLDNGLALTPQMGWNSYNHYSCSPNETIIKSNAQALVDLGLDKLGYVYVVTDCGWSVPGRAANGTITWNPSLFPDGFPALGQFIHAIGLKFGVYSDGGVQMCSTPEAGNTTGSLGHETSDANTFASWGADLLKYDNCYSEAPNYPNVDYTPAASPSSRYQTMLSALEATGRKILFQICEWGVDFPAAWAPSLGNSWRVTNDIIPVWGTIYRILNQVVPVASYAGPGHWPDLDLLEVGNDVFNTAEEQTHFSLWAIMKSPLVISAPLKDTFTSIKSTSLAILSNKDVISYNQDSLGVSANLTRRWTEQGLDTWAGPLSGGRTIVALINWANNSASVSLDLPDIGLQSAGSVKDIWKNKQSTNVLTSYPKTNIPAHGTLLLELGDTQAAGVYPTALFATNKGDTTTFSNIYGVTASTEYGLTITLSSACNSAASIKVSSSAVKGMTIDVPAGAKTVTTKVALKAGNDNKLTFKSDSIKIGQIEINKPSGTFYGAPAFTTSGTASHINCTSGLCQPVGAKIGYITPNGSASISIAKDTSTTASGTKYVEITYINNDIAFLSSFSDGRNARNITVQVNNAAAVRLEVPLSGRSSELYSPMLGWGDPATLGLLVDGFGTGSGNDTVTVGNVGGEKGVQSYGADFVGLRIY